VLIRDKTDADAGPCLDLLRRVHAVDNYPLILPADVSRFIAPPYEVRAWVAVQEGEVLGHVALHRASVDPTFEAAQRATGLPAERLVVLSRLFVDPRLRRSGLGRSLLNTATSASRSRGQRAVLDVGQTLLGPIALYESEGWIRAEALQITAVENESLNLWVYVSPDRHDG
jgi:predicted N-acetyltransferase YhbS